MEENKIIIKISFIIASIIMVLIIITVGLDTFMAFPLFLFLWFAAGAAASVIGHFISAMTELLTGKDHLYMIQVCCSGILTLITVIWAIYEKVHYFMGHLGAAILLFFFTLPLAANTIIWIIKWHTHIISEKHNQEQ